MIGNDIIDLALATKESNWKRKGFLQKIFTPSEQSMIRNDDNPEVKVWDLWSRKESVYKIYNRETRIRAFMPLRIECYDEFVRDGYLYGKSKIGNAVFFTKTHITTDFILTIASKKLRIIPEIKEIPLGQCNTLLFKDADNIPYQLNLLTLERKEVSISHHGRFCSHITI